MELFSAALGDDADHGRGVFGELRNSGNQVPNPDAVSQFNAVINNYSAQAVIWEGWKIVR